jgi:cell wall-associated NlpC family hydrolase
VDAYVYRPQAIVYLYTEQGQLVARGTNNPKSSMDDDVIRISTTREIGADAPTFTIELTMHKPWNSWVASNDLVVIKMQRPPEDLQTVMFGLVDDSRETVSVTSDGAPTRSVTITGRGISKALINFDVSIVPEAEYQMVTTGWVESTGVILAGKKPSEIIKAAWDIICKKHINYKWDNGKKLFDYVTYKVVDRPNMSMLDSSAVANWQGTMWSFFREIAEDPFYELYEEIEGGKPTIIARATPFNESSWKNLELFTITDADVVDEDLGRSDVETYTIFSVGAKSLFAPNDIYKTFGVLPYWYKPYADKYGNRRLHVESAYTAVANSSITADQTEVMRSMMKDLYNWNIKNNSFVNGNIIVKGHAMYRVGCRLDYASMKEDDYREYYITAVNHVFENFGSYVTQLGVTRGINSIDRFTAPWGSYKEYSGLGVLPYDPVAAKKALMNGAPGTGTGTVSSVDMGVAIAVVDGARGIMNNGIAGRKVTYIMGGSDPILGKLDCSSFVQFVYLTYANIDLGRVTGVQVQKGVEVTADQAQPGDLVFFKNTYISNYIFGVSHVGIYIGGGQMIDNNSGEGTVVIDNLSDSYWKEHFLMYRRVLPMVTGSDGSIGSSSTMYGYAQQAAKSLNWNPDLIMAQWILETNHFGSHVFQTDHNLAGIKWASAKNNPGATGPGVKANDGGYYAHYDNTGDGVKGYIDFVGANSRYSNVSSTQDARGEAELLHQDGWATDPDYVTKIMSVINSEKGSWTKYSSGDHDSPSNPSGNGSGNGGNGDSNAKKIWNFLLGKGVSKHGAAAVLGNLQQESSCNPGKSGGGLAQWRDSRWTNYVSYCNSQGTSTSSLSSAMGYLWQEMNSGLYISVSNLSNMSISQGTIYFCNKFEIAGITAMDNRISNAQTFYNTFK